MRRKVRIEMLRSISLVLAGWFAFIIGIYITEPIIIKIALLTAARVLP
ncbi:hypothetical protein ES703_95772 [subsurface metagenome]